MREANDAVGKILKANFSPPSVIQALTLGISARTGSGVAQIVLPVVNAT